MRCTRGMAAMSKRTRGAALGYSDHAMDFWGAHYFDFQVVAWYNQLLNGIGHGAFAAVPAIAFTLIAPAHWYWRVVVFSCIIGNILLIAREVFQFASDEDHNLHLLDRARDALLDPWLFGFGMSVLFTIFWR